ncbi:MAG: ABC transporter ATP-binding protein, partial [Hyphomicrobiales bacterium]|nr:ABC transporter ATP-binding protein [Hyphomicrobiales bacterium]
MDAKASDFRALRLDALGRDFGGFAALKSVSFEVARGEFVALLGPSGCGKSTALNCVAGLLPSTRGAIWLDDRRIDGLAPEKRGFGMVFQNYALFPHMSVEDNVAFGLRMRGEAKAAARTKARAALDLVRLGGQAEKSPAQLSGGQQQRVAIARAIVVEPPVVLMDEPLSNLDAKLRLEMRQEIRRIHRQIGAATIYVTHDQEEALSLADRIVVMRDGEVRQIGAPAELYARPATLDVAEFMGFRNRLKARVTAVAGGRASVALAGGAAAGVAMGAVAASGAATFAARPEDVAPTDGPDGVTATVVDVEYRGDGHLGAARTADGADVLFHSAAPLSPGAQVRLGFDPARALVFAG